MSRAITKEDMALLKEASEMFKETGCVPGMDGEPVPAERIVQDAKEYILETIDDPVTHGFSDRGGNGDGPPRILVADVATHYITGTHNQRLPTRRR